MKFLLLWLFLALAHPPGLIAFELPPLNATITDSAGIFPPASLDDLNARLSRFKTETARTVVVLTIKSADDEDIEQISREAFAKLPLSSGELANTALLVVARKEHAVGLYTGTNLQPLFPMPKTLDKLHAQYILYADGLRPDLGIHGAVHYVFRVIRGDVNVDALSDEEKLEGASLRGAGAGPIFAVCLGPFLAFFVSALWGVYATHYGVERRLRLLMGAVFAGATAKGIIAAVNFLGPVSDTIFYFIMAIAIPLGIFASWTEFWMSGTDWRGIPRIKERQRKPEDKMGI